MQMKRMRTYDDEDKLEVEQLRHELKEEQKTVDYFNRRLKNEIRGGFEPVCRADVVYMRQLCVHPRYRAMFNWCSKSEPLLSPSMLSLEGENYVMAYLRDEWGVRAKLQLVIYDKFGNPEWIMSGMCPFHRREHSKQNWMIKINSKLETEIMCFHPPAGRSCLFWAEPGIPIHGKSN